MRIAQALPMTVIRAAAVAGTWYPGSAAALGRAVDEQLARARPDVTEQPGPLVALIAPHAGLMYSGPVAACAYNAVRGRSFDVVVVVGPSHFVPFRGVSIHPTGAFRTPLGDVPIDEGCAAAIMGATPIVRELPAAHDREHSLEMQLPFIQRVAPMAKIVPLLVGHQSADVAQALADGLAVGLKGRRALLVASTDLSHYHDAATAARLDAVVIDHVNRFDAAGLQQALDRRPGHACGGAPMVAVMRAAWLLGARFAVTCKYADSGDVSGDKSAVVGYMAALLGNTVESVA